MLTIIFCLNNYHGLSLNYCTARSIIFLYGENVTRIESLEIFASCVVEFGL